MSELATRVPVRRPDRPEFYKNQSHKRLEMILDCIEQDDILPKAEAENRHKRQPAVTGAVVPSDLVLKAANIPVSK